MNGLCLNKISLNENLLLFCFKGSNFYNTCLEYNLNTLEEIFDFFNNNDIVEKNKYSYMEIHGIVNILKCFYLNEKISFWNKLNKKTIGYKSHKDKLDYLYNKYYALFRSLGFASSEAFELCYELEYSDEIGNAIVRLYYKKMKSDTKINTSQNHYVFFKKLEILANYYLKNIKNFGNADLNMILI